MGMEYKDLGIYQLSHKLAVEIHKMIMDKPERKIYNFIKGLKSGHKSTSNIKHPTSGKGRGEVTELGTLTGGLNEYPCR